MNAINTGSIILAVILSVACIFVLGYCAGSLAQLTQYLKELKREIFETDRDLKTLNEMQKDHEKHMEKLERLSKEYQDALIWYSKEAELRELFVGQQREKPKGVR